MVEVGTLYFAYGCNMDPDQLADVTGLRIRAGYPARLPGWRVGFTVGGEHGSTFATLLPAPGCVSYGVVYRLPWTAMAPLDRFEGVPEHYRRETVWVEPLGRPARQAAITYLAASQEASVDGRPGPGYIRRILRGARTHSLPAAYVRWIRNLAEGRTAECYRERATGPGDP